MNLFRRVTKMLQSVGAARDEENPNTRKAEAIAMNVRAPARFVGEELPVQGSAVQTLAEYRHCSAIRFEEEQDTLAPITLTKLHRKNSIRNDADTALIIHADVPLKRRSLTVARGKVPSCQT